MFRSGTVSDRATYIEARAVAGTGEAVRALLHSTAEVGADQAQGGESAFGVDQDGGRIGEEGPRVEGELFDGTQIEFRFGNGVGFEIQKADQPTQGERSAHPQESIAE